MCYNLAVEATRRRFQEEFGWDPGDSFCSSARLNAFDRPLIPALTLEKVRLRWTLARWGLATRLAGSSDPKVHFNARWETAPQKPSFRDAYAMGRMVLAVNGFWEWMSVPGRARKRLVRFSATSGWLFLAAIGTGVGSANELPCFTLLTLPSCGVVADVHDRMPLALAPPHWHIWLTNPDRPLLEEEARTQALGWTLTTPPPDDAQRGLFDDRP